MAIIRLTTEIAAPVERVFDLSLCIELHEAAMARTHGKAVGGVTTGLMTLGDSVTWRARHFGLWLRQTSRITAVDRPHHFRDSMVRGAFKRIDHDHYFEARNGATIMRDVFDFNAPLGVFGTVAERVFLTAYMRAFHLERNRVLKAVAESDQWRAYLGDQHS